MSNVVVVVVFIDSFFFLPYLYISSVLSLVKIHLSRLFLIDHHGKISNLDLDPCPMTFAVVKIKINFSLGMLF